MNCIFTLHFIIEDLPVVELYGCTFTKLQGRVLILQNDGLDPGKSHYFPLIYILKCMLITKET